MEKITQLSDFDTRFLKLYHNQPEPLQIFIECILFVHTTVPKETTEYGDMYHCLKSHSKGELKRAIKAAREYQATHREAPGLNEAIETTVDFIRRELMQKEAV